MNNEALPFISVCIPAYQRTHYLKRLLESIAKQTFRNFEVVLSDDSKDDTVEQLAQQYKTKFILHYYKNEKALGTPANWNFGIAKARGEWIKLMHDDDWFASASALQSFANATASKQKFIFAAYTNFFEGSQARQTVTLNQFWKRNIKVNPAVLIARNVIGPPSVTLVHKSVTEQYDERLKWRVDTDFYERVLRNENNFFYLDQPLINVGISESQVTQSCLYKPEVELPEGLILLEKHGFSSLKNILVYDAWWRLLRNMNIKTEQQLYAYTNKKWPHIILSLTNDLSKIPTGILNTGLLSKLSMSFSYLKNRNKI